MSAWEFQTVIRSYIVDLVGCALVELDGEAIVDAVDYVK